MLISNIRIGNPEMKRLKFPYKLLNRVRNEFTTFGCIRGDELLTDIGYNAIKVDRDAGVYSHEIAFVEILLHVFITFLNSQLFITLSLIIGVICTTQRMEMRTESHLFESIFHA